MIYLFNTLGRKKEEFKSIYPHKVFLYHCGPTVYDRQHIGNLRAAVIWDTLRRMLEWNKYRVKQIVNITDFGHLTSDADEGEDKMAKGLRRENLPFTRKAMKILAKKYATLYFEDREKVNAKKPYRFPFASDFIKKDIAFIKILEKKGFTYKTHDGVYFDTSKYKDYGKLGGLSEIQESRIGVNTEKRNPRDFVLWKGNPEIGWPSLWGKGFPGWHIECSVMSKKYLGKTFDIHTGGIEHIPIHHNNEIAQSEAAHDGKPMAHYWLHNEHLILPGGKMAKSLGNSITLKEVEDQGFDPLALRLLFLQAHYRSPLIFSWEALAASETALNKLKNIMSGYTQLGKGKVNEKYFNEFTQIINDDLDTSKALALLWNLLKDETIDARDKRATALAFDKIFGLELISAKQNKKTISPEIQELITQREKAREAKNWTEADRLRDLIHTKGFEIKDTESGSEIL